MDRAMPTVVPGSTAAGWQQRHGRRASEATQLPGTREHRPAPPLFAAGENAQARPTIEGKCCDGGGRHVDNPAWAPGFKVGGCCWKKLQSKKVSEGQQQAHELGATEAGSRAPLGAGPLVGMQPKHSTRTTSHGVAVAHRHCPQLALHSQLTWFSKARVTSAATTSGVSVAFA